MELVTTPLWAINDSEIWSRCRGFFSSVSQLSGNCLKKTALKIVVFWNLSSNWRQRWLKSKGNEWPEKTFKDKNESTLRLSFGWYRIWLIPSSDLFSFIAFPVVFFFHSQLLSIFRSFLKVDTKFDDFFESFFYEMIHKMAKNLK